MNTIFFIFSILSLAIFAKLWWNADDALIKIEIQCETYDGKELWLPKDSIDIVSLDQFGLATFYYIRRDNGKYLMRNNDGRYKWTDTSASADGAMHFNSYNEAQTFIEEINHMK